MINHRHLPQMEHRRLSNIQRKVEKHSGVHWLTLSCKYHILIFGFLPQYALCGPMISTIKYETREEMRNLYYSRSRYKRLGKAVGCNIDSFFWLFIPWQRSWKIDNTPFHNELLVARTKLNYILVSCPHTSWKPYAYHGPQVAHPWSTKHSLEIHRQENNLSNSCSLVTLAVVGL